MIFVKIILLLHGGETMPNIKSVKKRVKTSAKARDLNNVHRTSMRTAIKKVEKIGNGTKVDDAKKALDRAVKKIDKALAKGIIHKNKAARAKARLSKKVNQMK